MDLYGDDDDDFLTQVLSCWNSKRTLLVSVKCKESVGGCSPFCSARPQRRAASVQWLQHPRRCPPPTPS